MNTRTLIKCSVLSLLLCSPVWTNAAGMQGQQESQQRGMNGSSAMKQPMQMRSQEHSQLLNMKVKDINRLTVVNSGGDRLGKVKKLVRNNANNQIEAVVSVGGFFGIGSKNVTIPLNQLQLRQGNLTADNIMTKEQLKQQSEYQKANYKDLNENQILADVEGAGMGQRSGVQASFDDLDTDHNGVISKEEAQNHLRIVDSWKEIDKNGDNKLERSEFSAFEEMRPQGSPSTGGGGMMQQGR